MRITRLSQPVTSLGDGIDKTSVGLGDVDNTSDEDKPISIATQAALDLKEDLLPTGTAGQYLRGDKSLATLNKTAVGLANADNTSDVDKPISSATQAALDDKVDHALAQSKGDVLVATGPGTFVRFPAGPAGYAMVSAPGSTAGVTWTALPDSASPLTIDPHPTLANVGTITYTGINLMVMPHPTLQNIGRISI